MAICTLGQNLEILSKIQYISLPYDGHIKQIADYYRGEGYFEIEKRAFEIVERYGVKIGLHTLVTPYNVNYIDAMAESLFEKSYFNRIWYWYIKKFKKINCAVDSPTDIYELEENEYHSTLMRVKSCYGQINIIESGQVNKEILTLFISLDGDVFIYKKGTSNNTLIGNLLVDDIHNILKKI